MFIVLLKFSVNKARAGELIEGHKAWLEQGFDDGVFLMAGSVQPDRGGVVWAHGETLDRFRRRVNEDPFVAEDVVSAEILEVAPSRADARLQSLLG